MDIEVGGEQQEQHGRQVGPPLDAARRSRTSHRVHPPLFWGAGKSPLRTCRRTVSIEIPRTAATTLTSTSALPGNSSKCRTVGSMPASSIAFLDMCCSKEFLRSPQVTCAQSNSLNIMVLAAMAAVIPITHVSFRNCDQLLHRMRHRQARVFPCSRGNNLQMRSRCSPNRLFSP